jgi:hypothetical protein
MERSSYLTRFLYFMVHDHMTPRDIQRLCQKADAPGEHDFEEHLLAYAQEMADVISEKE